MKSKEHWEKVYSTKLANSVSWFQEHAAISLKIIREANINLAASIIDVGGGASTLVDDLMKVGFQNLTVLDISEEALSLAQDRLKENASKALWITSDITKADLPNHHYDVWHDRAVFHFLISEYDHNAYIKTVLHAVKPGGHVIVATFAEDGPLQCSGLPVMRYTAEQLYAEFGAAFELVAHVNESHDTPFGTTQKFVYCYCRKIG